MARFAASLIGAGTGKCGWPMLRLIGSFRLAARAKTFRMPETSMERVRCAIQESFMDAIVWFPCLRLAPAGDVERHRLRALNVNKKTAQNSKIVCLFPCPGCYNWAIG